MAIADRLKSLRESRNISVYKLSQLSGVSETFIRELERGIRNPSFDTLSRIAAQLDIPLSELVNESDEISFLNKREKELLEYFRLLSNDKADGLLYFLKTLV